MTKFQTILASLVAAVPALILAALLVMSFINYGGGPNVMFQAITGLTLLATILLGLSPVGILLFSGRPAAEPKPEKKEAEDAEDEDEDKDEEVEDLVEEEEAVEDDEVVEAVADDEEE